MEAWFIGALILAVTMALMAVAGLIIWFAEWVMGEDAVEAYNQHLIRQDNELLKALRDMDEEYEEATKRG